MSEPPAGPVLHVGVVTPHDAAGAEAEWELLAPGRVVTHVARVGPTESPPGTPAALRALAAPAALDAALTRLGGLPLDAIAHASSSTGYALGSDAELTMTAALERRWNLPAVSTADAAVTALRRLGITRISLVHPPWFGAGPAALGARYFRDQGCEVVAAQLAAVPADPRHVQPEHVIDWVTTHVTDDADAVFLGGNGFRAVAAVARLEQLLDRPVLTSNQVLLQALLERAGVRSG